MVTIQSFRALALSFPEVIELPHFHLASFRINKKIFATLSEKDKRVMIKLSLPDQSVFCAFDPAVIYPVPGGWGRQGSTFFELQKIRKGMLKDALTLAYCSVAPKRLVEEVNHKK